jgi:ADP-heptose:LPS heptosyltransferase
MAWQEKLPDDVKWGLVAYTRGMGLEVGCGPKTTFPHFIGVDSLPNSRLYGTHVQPDVVVKTVTKLQEFATGSLDFVFAPQHPNGTEQTAIAEWWRVLKTGGHLCLYVKASDVSEINGWEMIRDDEVEGGRFQVYRKMGGAEHRRGRVKIDPKPAKSVAVVRLGAFGDLVQASSVFPSLKEQGYHLTLYTAPRGYEVAKSDPHVDAFVVQDPDQVPLQELGDFWKWIKSRHDRFINLSESVEGNLLPTPDRSIHGWPHALRHAVLDLNYLEVVHAIAGAPFPPRQHFYPSEEEKSWARRERAKLSGPVVLWTLSGSSVHKTWPYLDKIIAMILTNTTGCVVLVGDESCQLLEQNWEAESRVVRRSGVWSIRQTLAFIDQADLLVGPETGVMNAAGLHPVPKIVTLSHSSPENLTKHWKNCISLVPGNTPCWPCHQLHYGFEHCKRDEATGTAACQADIPADAMWNAMQTYMRKAA